MKKPISKEVLYEAMRGMGITDLSRTTIRQCSLLGNVLEERTGEQFSHL